MNNNLITLEHIDSCFVLLLLINNEGGIFKITNIVLILNN